MFDARPDPGAVCSFLASEGIDSGRETIVENVFALPPAHALQFSWRDRSLKTWRYWDLDGERIIRFSDDQQYADGLGSLPPDSAELRAAALGRSLWFKPFQGLDSSTIGESGCENEDHQRARRPSPRASRSRRLTRGCTSSAWPPLAGVRNHSVYPDPRNLPKEIEPLTWQQDAPFHSSSIYAQWCVMRLARDRGVTVLLDAPGC